MRPKHELALALVALIVGVGFLLPSTASAQQPAAPPPDPGTWVGTAGAGLALTSGNSDTLNFNLAFDATRDPKTRNVMQWTGLFIRGEQDDALVANRLSLAFRDQYALSDRSFVFGQLDYLRDTFKLIDYLIAPTAGLGYKLVDPEITKFAVDGGLGVVWEKNPDRDARTSMALRAMNAAQKPQAVAPPEPSKEEVLLTQIRDILARR